MGHMEKQKTKGKQKLETQTGNGNEVGAKNPPITGCAISIIRGSIMMNQPVYYAVSYCDLTRHYRLKIMNSK